MKNLTQTKLLALKELKKIPGVGPSISEDLWNIGIKSVSDLKKKNPLSLYEKLNSYCYEVRDRCVLYVFRCAVYFAENRDHDPELLKWWNWKDKKYEVESNR